jgi:hypothetical protein
VDHPPAVEDVVSDARPDLQAGPDGADGGRRRVGGGPGAVTPAVRAGAVAALAVLVVLSGALLGRAGTKAPPPTAGARLVSGATFCPHGGGDGWKGWLAVVNPGSEPVNVRATTFAGSSIRLVRRFTLPAGREIYREIPVSDPASATEVEYFGGLVAAGTVVRSSGTNPDVAAERCVSTAGSNAFLPDETTAADEHASVIVMNPFADPAEFDVVIRTNLPRTVRPGPLTPAVLRPFSAVAIPIEPWAREGPGENAVTVQITSIVGRVVAGSMVVSPRGVRAEAGIPLPAKRAVIPAAGYGGGSIEILNPGTRRAVMTVVAEGPSGPSAVAGASGSVVGPGSARTFDVGDQTDAGIHADAGGGATVVMLHLSGPNGGEAAIGGWSEVVDRWAVPPTLPSTGGTAHLVLQNPGATPATARITWISPSGRVGGGPSVAHVGANRTVTVDMPKADVPLFALVTVLSGSVVPGETSMSVAGTAFAGTTGVPIT